MVCKVFIFLCFFSVLVAIQAQGQGGFPGISSIPGMGSGSSQQAMFQMMTDPCTYKTMGNIAQVLAASQQQNSGGSGGSSGGIPGLSNIPGSSGSSGSSGSGLPSIPGLPSSSS